MNDYNLIRIGRFGYKFGQDGSFEIRVNDNFHTGFLTLNEFFVIIDEDKIRFIVTEKLTKKGRLLSGRFKNPEIVAELRKAAKVWLALNKEAYNDLVFPEEKLIGLHVFHQDIEIGTVTDLFYNGAHNVLIIKLTDEDRTIMIPEVDVYITEKDFSSNRVVVRNIDELKEL